MSRAFGSPGRRVRAPRAACAAVLLGALALGLAPACGPRHPAPERIILIVVDTLRRDALSCYGSENVTPRIDALAARGARYPNSYGSFHQTPMSMGAMFTGRTPSVESGIGREVICLSGLTWCGLARFRSQRGEPRCIPNAIPTLAERLREAGYWTMGVTSNSMIFAPFGIERGFDDWSEVGSRVMRRRRLDRPVDPGLRQELFASRSAEPVNASVRAALERRRDDRFFLYVHYMEPHDYDRRNFASYGESVTRLDAALGELLDELQAQGLLEGAWIVFTADHGERLGERHWIRGRGGHRGNPSFGEVLRVPLITVPPLLEDPNRMVRSEDVFFLITRAAGLATEVPRALEPAELFLSEEEWQTYRKGRYKSYVRRDDGRHHLVDLQADVREQRNVAARHPEIVAEHQRRIGELAKRLGTASREEFRLRDEDRRRLRALGYLE